MIDPMNDGLKIPEKITADYLAKLRYDVLSRLGYTQAYAKQQAEQTRKKFRNLPK